jgi:ferredoxin
LVELTATEVYAALTEEHPWFFMGSSPLRSDELSGRLGEETVPMMEGQLCVVVFGLPIRDLALWIWHGVGPRRYLFANHVLERAADVLLRLAAERGRWALDVARRSANRISLVELACKVGLGSRGINNLFLHPTYGAWVQLHAVVLELSSDVQDAVASPSVCIGCNRCVAACPAHAITSQAFYADRCNRMVASFWMPKSKARATSESTYVECHKCISECPIGVHPGSFIGGEVL